MQMKAKKNRKSVVCFCLFVCLLIVFCFIGTKIMKKAYEETLAEESEKTAQQYYDWAFDKAEKNSHVSNRGSITIGDIKEQSKLEVLQVSDEEFVVQNTGEDRAKETAWIAVPGKGVFTVDMEISEFLIDNERHTVIARVPKPRLTSSEIIDEDIKIYNVETGTLKNGNYSRGEEIADAQLKEGFDMIKEKLSGQQYLSWAEESANRIITDLIKNLNPDIEDLNIEIEFID